MINKLVIPFELWGMRRLLNQDGTMCCLGHLSKACGIAKENLLNRTMPGADWTEVPRWARARRLPWSWSDADIRAADANDSSTLSKQEKVTQITKIFAENDIELTFTGNIDDAKV